MNDIRPNALAIIRKNDFILAAKGMDKTTGETFYRLMGGGIDFGELSSEALKREFKEELNATIINETFLTVIENVFEFNAQKKHEITFLFKADLKESDVYDQERIPIVDKEHSYAEWILVEKIKSGDTTLYPKETVHFL